MSILNITGPASLVADFRPYKGDMLFLHGMSNGHDWTGMTMSAIILQCRVHYASAHHSGCRHYRLLEDKLASFFCVHVEAFHQD